MIDELKSLLDVIAKLPDLALWAAAGFGIYKLIMYLSTTGAIVYVAKLLINKVYDAYVAPSPLIARGITQEISQDDAENLDRALTRALREHTVQQIVMSLNEIKHMEADHRISYTKDV